MTRRCSSPPARCCSGSSSAGSSACSPATSAARSTPSSALLLRRVPRHPGGGPRARAGGVPPGRVRQPGGGAGSTSTSSVRGCEPRDAHPDPRHRDRVDPAARPHHARQHAVVVAARVRARGAGPGREAPAHHDPRGAAQRAAGDVVDRAARHRGGDRRRGHARASSASASRPPTPSWGNIIAVDRGNLAESPHIVFEPALFIFFTVLALNFLGDVVRSRLRRAGGRPVSDTATESTPTPRRRRRRPPLLEVTDVKTHFETERGLVRAVDGVSFDLERGQDARHRRRVGFGQDRAVALDHGPAAQAGRRPRGLDPVRGHRDRRRSTPRQMREYWGAQMAMVFQDPMTSLNPVMKIGKQITESIRQHLDVDKDFANELAENLLRVGAHPRARAAAEGVPAPAVGRHAPTRVHRGRAGVRPAAAVRRRAHHRARRDRAGPGARPAWRHSSASGSWRWCSSPTTSASSPGAPTRSR